MKFLYALMGSIVYICFIYCKMFSVQLNIILIKSYVQSSTGFKKSLLNSIAVLILLKDL